MSDLSRRLARHLRKKPRLGSRVFIAPGAVVLGDVTLGEGSSVWYNAVLRGDIHRIEIGHHTNIQDGAVVHLARDFPCILGNYVTVGHNATVHACVIEDECLIGMNATILDGARVGAQSIVGANALVAPGAQIPPGSLVLGVPGKVARSLRPEERRALRSGAEEYAEYAAYCVRHRIGRFLIHS